MSECIMIVSGRRTAMGKFEGALKDLEATDLGDIVIRGTVKRSGLKPENIKEVVYGYVRQAIENAFATRLALVKAGIPHEATALTANRLCSSGLQAIVAAAQEIESDIYKITVADGYESTTNTPFYLRKVRYKYYMGHEESEDGLVTALSDPLTHSHMGIVVESVTNQYNMARWERDRWAIISQQRVSKAQEEGKFDSKIVPIEVKVSKEEIMISGKGERVCPGTTVESLAKLYPAFRDDGSVTAGNTTEINNAAATMVLMRESKANALGLKPLVHLVDVATAGVDPFIMEIGPVPAFRKLLKKTGIRKEEIGLIELSETFVTQTATCMKELELGENIVNVNGSGISFGYPIGAAGCIIIIKLINKMIRRRVGYGISTLCIKGGQGLVVLFELCS